MVGQLVAIEIEHKQTDRRRQVAVLSLGINRGDEIRQGHVAPVGDLLEAPPERILEADTGLVASDDDGALDDRRFHRSSPLSIRWRSRSRRALASRLVSSSRSAWLRPWRSRLADALRSAGCRPAFLRAAHPALDEPLRGDAGPSHVASGPNTPIPWRRVRAGAPAGRGIQVKLFGTAAFESNFRYQPSQLIVLICYLLGVFNIAAMLHPIGQTTLQDC